VRRVDELGLVEKPPVQRKGRGDSDDPELTKRAPGAPNHLLTIRAVDNQFGQ
jgi:hypothetical protein